MQVIWRPGSSCHSQEYSSGVPGSLDHAHNTTQANFKAPFSCKSWCAKSSFDKNYRNRGMEQFTEAGNEITAVRHLLRKFIPWNCPGFQTQHQRRGR